MRQITRTKRSMATVVMLATLLAWSTMSVAAPPTASPDCGTGATVVGSDLAGKVTLGTRTQWSTCTLVFTVALENAPACTAMNETNSGSDPAVIGTKTTRTTLLLSGESSKGANLG